MSQRFPMKRLIAALLCGMVSFAATYRIAPKLLPFALQVRMDLPRPGNLQLFWDTGSGFSEAESRSVGTEPGMRSYTIPIPAGSLNALRLDPCSCQDDIKIEHLKLGWLWTITRWDSQNVFDGWAAKNDVRESQIGGGALVLRPGGSDPFLVQENSGSLRSGFFLQLMVLSVAGALLVFFLAWIFSAEITAAVGAGSAARESVPVAAGGGLGGPLVMLGSIVISLLLAYGVYLLLMGRSGAAPVFTGDDGIYALSFVSTSGESISKQRGKLKLVIDPFTVYRTLPSQQTANYTIDAEGFRGGMDNRKQKKIFVLGGSAAFGQGLAADSEAFAARLGVYQPEFDVVNAGVVGYLSGQELALMIHKLDSYQPAAYIVFDGWNELFDQFISMRRQGDYFGFNNTFFFVQERLVNYAKELKEYLPAERDRATAMSLTDDAYLDEIRRHYVANLQRMNAFAKGRGAKFLAVFQPELSGKQTKSPDEQKNLDGWEKAYGYVKNGFPQRYKTMLSLTKQELDRSGVQYVDLNEASLLNGEAGTLYFDVVHLNREGHDRVAQLLSKREEFFR